MRMHVLGKAEFACLVLSVGGGKAALGYITLDLNEFLKFFVKSESYTTTFTLE